MGKRYALLFDLDGTLIDSSEGIVDAYQFTLANLELPFLDADAIRQFIGPSIYEVLTTKFGLDVKLAMHGVTVFRRRYQDYGLFRYRKYDGIDDALNAFLQDDFLLAVATGKLESMANQIVADAGWIGRFHRINGTDDNGKRISKKDVIDRALGCLPEKTKPMVMIGDTPADIIAGRDASLIGVGVSWGFGRVEDLVESGAERVATDPSNLVEIVNAFIK